MIYERLGATLMKMDMLRQKGAASQEGRRGVRSEFRDGIFTSGQIGLVDLD